MGRAKVRTVAVALAATVVLAALGIETVEACMHPPEDVSGPGVTKSDQAALIYFRDGREDLFVTAGGEAEAELSKLGWVLPVPSVPDDYGTADPALFEKMAAWMAMEVFYRRPRLTTGAAKPGGKDESEPDLPDLKVLPSIETGPFAITPLQASGKAGLKELRKWWRANGIRIPESSRPARYYVERGWTFLAVRVDPQEGAEHLELEGRLPPLHLSFQTERAVYPLKFETNQGEFSTELYVVTDDKLERSALAGATERGFFVAGGPDVSPIPSVRTMVALRTHHQPGYPAALRFMVEHDVIRRDDAPETLVDALGSAGAWRAESKLHVRTLYAPSVNRGFAEPDIWDEDLAIPPVPSGKKLEGSLDTHSIDEPDREKATAKADDGSEADEPETSRGCRQSGGGPVSPLTIAMIFVSLGSRRRG